MKVLLVGFVAAAMLATPATAQDTQESVLADARSSALCMTTIMHSVTIHAFGLVTNLLAGDGEAAGLLAQRVEAERGLGQRVENAYRTVVRPRAERTGINPTSLDRRREQVMTTYDTRLSAALRSAISTPQALMGAVVALTAEVEACEDWVEDIEQR